MGLNRRALLAALTALPVAARAPGRILHRDDFRHGLKQWRIEAAGEARVQAAGGVLDIDTPAGLTLWFLPELIGPVAIDYEVRAVAQGGPDDEVSDVNAFWMATDPVASKGSVLATRRSGVFEEYDTLRTYYVGIGGNRNTTTRMRRYVGKAGERPLLPEHDRLAKADMLVPNRWFRLRLIANGQRIAVERDGAPLFSMSDDDPYRRGHFGVRTTQSHIQLRNFSISRV
ncbi:DUF6250 domain-containing protein [Sphingobium sp. BYY-5]|uniref:DUF6250 domain-containing protein n=1 Tax=Sphingobium sp. BYY-5 TaxID=2926400 RepID=UPI001FA7F935|nr:DUF6250 domain-containing protein [Sphingobium sp. BYY-5]MCI4591929.1 DUF6250 domain-containing protein [Sphingobium sp. BYY-5]